MRPTPRGSAGCTRAGPGRRVPAGAVALGVHWLTSPGMPRGRPRRAARVWGGPARWAARQGRTMGHKGRRKEPITPHEGQRWPSTEIVLAWGCAAIEHMFDYNGRMAALASSRTVPVGTVGGAAPDGLAARSGRHRGRVRRPAAATAMGEADRVITRMQAVRLALVAEADRCEVASETGLSGTSAWLAPARARDGGQAARDVRLATALDNGLPATREALAAGDVSTEHAQVIATAAAQLPDGLSRARACRHRGSLVRRAKLVDPATLRKRPAVPWRPRERRRPRSMPTRTRCCAPRRTPRSPRPDSLGTTTATAPRAVISRCRRWRRGSWSRRCSRSPRRAGSPSRRPGPPRPQVPGTAAQEVADRHVGGLPGGRRRLGAPLRQGVRRAARAPAHRLAVRQGRRDRRGDHRPRPAQGGRSARPTSTPGTTSRPARPAGSPATRASCPRCWAAGRCRSTSGGRAVLHRSPASGAGHDLRHLRSRGCDRPYAWSELHHEDPWAQWGPTDLALAVPLCGHHHRRIHDPRYAHRIDTDVLGKKSVTYTRRT